MNDSINEYEKETIFVRKFWKLFCEKGQENGLHPGKTFDYLFQNLATVILKKLGPKDSIRYFSVIYALVFDTQEEQLFINEEWEAMMKEVISNNAFNLDSNP